MKPPSARRVFGWRFFYCLVVDGGLYVSESLAGLESKLDNSLIFSIYASRLPLGAGLFALSQEGRLSYGVGSPVSAVRLIDSIGIFV